MTTQPRSPSRCCTFGCLSLVLGPALCLMILAGGWFLRERNAKTVADRRIAAIKEGGLPVDDASMQTYYGSRTDPTDTDAWVSILGIVSGPEFSESCKGIPTVGVADDVPRKGDWPSEKATRDFLSRWRTMQLEVFALSKKARPVRFPITFHSVKTVLSHSQNARQAARLMMLAGEVAAYDRNAEETRMAIESLFGLSQVLSGDPILVSQMVSLAIDGMAVGLLKQAIEDNILDEKSLQELLPIVQSSVDISPNWKSTIIGERCFGVTAFQSLPVNRATDLLYYLDAMESALKVSEDDLWNFQREMSRWNDSTLAAMSSNFLARMDSANSRTLLTTLEAASNAFLRQSSQHRLATLAMGVRLFEKRFGRKPATLDELKEIDMDVAKLHPIGDRPFGYRSDASGTLLWGFEIREMQSTPAEPPVRASIDENGKPASVLSELWAWQLF